METTRATSVCRSDERTMALSSGFTCLSAKLSNRYLLCDTDLLFENLQRFHRIADDFQFLLQLQDLPASQHIMTTIITILVYTLVSLQAEHYEHLY